MNLDDDILKATREINGSDKNVGSIEELIEELTKVQPHGLSKDGLKLFEYINEIIDRNKELEEKWDKDTHTLQNALDLANADKINNYIPVSLVEEKIEELDIKITYIESQYTNGGQNCNSNYLSALYQNQILQELLEKRK